MGIALSLVRRSHSLYCRRRQLYSASLAAPMSLRPDPLLGISRALLAIVGAGEIACAAVALGARSQLCK